MGRKKVLAIRRSTGLPVCGVLVRGGTDHRKDLLLEDGTIAHLYRDGKLELSDNTYDNRIATFKFPTGDSRPTK